MQNRKALLTSGLSLWRRVSRLSARGAGERGGGEGGKEGFTDMAGEFVGDFARGAECGYTGNTFPRDSTPGK